MTRIPEHLIHFECIQGSGPGGQNVNKLATKVRMRIALCDLKQVLSPLVFQRLTRLNKRHILGDAFIVTDQSTRSQYQNRLNCKRRLERFIEEAGMIPKVRKATKPSRASKVRRLRNKRLLSEKKQLRRQSKQPE